MLIFILIYTEVKLLIFFAEQNLSLIEKTPFIMCYSETILFFEEKEQSSERNLVVRKSFYSTFFGLGCFLLMPVIYFKVLNTQCCLLIYMCISIPITECSIQFSHIQLTYFIF